MPTTTTTYSFNKPVVGADEDDWGGYLNGNWDSVDDLLDGTTPVTGIDINSGTLDGVTIGGTTAGAGTFTTLTANTSITGTLATAAQTNITSVGTLTSLDVGGTVTADGLTVDGDSQFGNSGYLIYNNANPDITLRSVGGAASYGNVILDANGRYGSIQFRTGYDGSAIDNEQRMKIDTNGDISFYEDTGTTAKFFWDASAEQVQIGSGFGATTTPLLIEGSSYDPTANGGINSGGITIRGGTSALGNNTGALVFTMNKGAANAGSAGISGFQEANNDDQLGLAFFTHGSSTATNPAVERMRIDSSGNVGIGTSSIGARITLGDASSTDSTNMIRSYRGGGTSTYAEFGEGSGGAKLEHVGGGPVYFKTGGTERMRLDASGVVNIKNTGSTADFISETATSFIVGDGTGAQAMTVYTGTASNGAIYFADGSTGNATYRGGVQYLHGSDAMRFFTSASEVMRIDSSGSLLISTSTAYGDNGTTILEGEIYSRKTSSRSLTLDRRTTDGEIVQFRKDGSTVGSIGTAAAGTTAEFGIVSATGQLVLGTTTNNNHLQYDNTALYPVPDNTVNLGYSTLRWKDLYLSGGVYLGGTGSANKLDDYEEGTWTPSFEFNGGTAGQTYTTSPAGYYTKVGNVVSVWGGVNFSNKGTSTGTLSITGLPFATANTGNFRHCSNVLTALHTATSFTGVVLAQSSALQTRKINVTNQDTSVNYTDIQNNTGLFFQVTYETS